MHGGERQKHFNTVRGQRMIYTINALDLTSKKKTTYG